MQWIPIQINIEKILTACGANQTYVVKVVLTFHRQKQWIIIGMVWFVSVFLPDGSLALCVVWIRLSSQSEVYWGPLDCPYPALYTFGHESAITFSACVRVNAQITTIVLLLPSMRTFLFKFAALEE